MQAAPPYSDPIQTDLCVLFRLMPASVAEEHVEGIGAVLARLAGSSCSPFQIELLLDGLETLPARALACASAPRSTSAGAHVRQTTTSTTSRSRPRCGPSSRRPTARPSELSPSGQRRIPVRPSVQRTHVPPFCLLLLE